MSTVNNLQATVNWASAFLRYQPVAVSGNEPALMSANIVLQTILGAPFCWRWNRGTATFTCVADGTQDYSVAASDFGFIEQAWLKTPVSATAQDLKEMELKNKLSPTLEKARSKFIAAQSDDNAGNISFRLSAAPDLAYAVSVQYQKKAPLMLSLASTWSPVPDEFSHIYNWGFLAILSLLVNDARFPLFNQKFIAHLLGAADGLSEMQQSLFLNNWMEYTKSAERAALRGKQGIGAQAQY